MKSWWSFQLTIEHDKYVFTKDIINLIKKIMKENDINLININIEEIPFTFRREDDIKE